MEYVRGTTLRKTLEQRRAANNGEPDPLPAESHAITFMLEVLPAFGYLHRAGSALLRLQARQRHPHRHVAEADRHGRGVPHGRHDQRDLRHARDIRRPRSPTPGPRSPPTSTPSVARSRCLCTDARGYQTTYARVAPRRRRRAPVRGVRLAVPLPASGPPRPIPTTGSSRPTRWRCSSTACCARSSPPNPASPWPEASAHVHERAAQRLRRSRTTGARCPRRSSPSTTPPPRSSPPLAVAVTEPDEVLELLELAPGAHGRGAAARGPHAASRPAATTTPTPCSTRSRVADPWEWRVAWSSGLQPRSRRPTPTARWPSSAACTRRCRASSRRSWRWRTPPRAAATWRTPRTGTTSSLAPIPGSRPRSSGWPRCRTPARRPHRRDRGVRADPVDLELVRRRADRQGRDHARRATAAPVDRRRRRRRRRGRRAPPAPQGATGAADRRACSSAALGAGRCDGAPAGNGADGRASGGPRLPAHRDATSASGSRRPTAASRSSHPSGAERIALVDRANQLRPRTVL